MSVPRSRLGWLPPMLVGASTAIAAEVAMSMLLFSGPGFVRSLTVILFAEGAAFAAGLWSAPDAGSELVDHLRRRWVLCMLAFLVAGAYGTAWSVFPWLGEGPLGQGAGLAILAGFPLYAAGAVLGGLSVAANSDPGGRLRGQAAPAALGAAAGFLLTGLLLPRAPLPGSLLIASLVMLSLGGMVFGGVLGSVLQIQPLSQRPSRGGEVRVEERRLSVEQLSSRLLLEGPYVRREATLGDDGVVPWDVAVIRALMPRQETGWRVLIVGGGASSAPRAVLREHPRATVDVVERTGAVVELGREYFGTDLAIARGERVGVEVGNLDDLLGDATPEYDLIVVDKAALAPVGGVTGLSRATRARLLEAAHADGIIAWGPGVAEPGTPEVAEGWGHAAFRRGGDGRADEHVVLTRERGGLDWPPPFDGFETFRPEAPTVSAAVVVPEAVGP